MKYGGVENENKNGFSSKVNNTFLAIGLSFGIMTSGVTEVQAYPPPSANIISPADAKVVIDMVCNDPSMMRGSRMPKSACKITDDKS